MSSTRRNRALGDGGFKRPWKPPHGEWLFLFQTGQNKKSNKSTITPGFLRANCSTVLIDTRNRSCFRISTQLSPKCKGKLACWWNHFMNHPDFSPALPRKKWVLKCIEVKDTWPCNWGRRDFEVGASSGFSLWFLFDPFFPPNFSSASWRLWSQLLWMKWEMNGSSVGKLLWHWLWPSWASCWVFHSLHR